jgi:amidase
MSNSARERDADPTVETNESWRRLVINDVHAKPFDFSGSPTLSVPCGFTRDGLPLSVQFVGRALGEATICRIGHAYQQATGWHTRHPEV